jgi:hypothetical protein
VALSAPKTDYELCRVGFSGHGDDSKKRQPSILADMGRSLRPRYDQLGIPPAIRPVIPGCIRSKI